jgi:hypothetical protein
VTRDITPLENRALGALSFLVGAVPVLAILALFVATIARVHVPSVFFSAAVIAIVIAVGLQFPLLSIVCALAEDRIPENEQTRVLAFRHPFVVFVIWWCYVR